MGATLRVSRSSSIAFLTLGGRTSALSQSSPCYSPDGVIAAAITYAFWIRSGVPVVVAGQYVCEASGLCKVAGSVGVSDLIRGTCTDSTWASLKCPLYCTG